MYYLSVPTLTVNRSNIGSHTQDKKARHMYSVEAWQYSDLKDLANTTYGRISEYYKWQDYLH